ncbi:MAG: hypothetical protein COW30_07065 [Rhodospirillales bacterium CG15_BIG_FIL_POST_REV_8_21_14_020_66_15]|nr:MAG: hypothetical protein COW30_07065 [Rhodospirillales bacterium CG15_BIG_FIL_POST_REV_8_21_14_020_66_15]
MNALKKLDSRVSYRISRAKRAVFVRDDFKDLADYDQVGRSLRKMVSEGRLVKLGYGLYAKGRKSSVSGRMVPIKPLPDLARDALERLGIEIRQSQFEREYNSDVTTQVPTGRVIGVKGRVSRKIGYDGKYVTLAAA